MSTKPPGGGRFKPGQSGNPGGRPKVDPAIREALEAACPKAARRLVRLSESADEDIALKASIAILDRVLGKPAQTLEHTGDEGKPLTVSIVRKVIG